MQIADTLQANFHVISQTEAHVLIAHEGGSNWIYFPGDAFDPSVVEEFEGLKVMVYTSQMAEELIEQLQNDEALRIEFK